MGLIIKSTAGTAALLCFLASFSILAAPIYPGDDIESPESGNSHFETEPLVTMPLLEVSPLSSDRPTSIPGLSDPMGMGMDTGLRVFTGGVHFVDLLTNPKIDNTDDSSDIELPPGALSDIDILDDMESFYLFYDGRAFDKSILDLKSAEIIEKDGLPITTESSPLTLTGFGAIIPDIRDP